MEFNLSWDNSWRDDFNWDAAWIFLKYKKRGTDQVWHHAYLCREGHTATPVTGNEGGDYTFMFGEVGSSTAAKVTGIYLMRDGISEGKVNAKVQVKWPIKSNTKLSLSASDFGVNRDSIYVAAYATEMVYVPYGSYALGDNFSNATFSRSGGGLIPPIYDIVDNKSGYTITASCAYYSQLNAADRVNKPTYGGSNSWEIYNCGGGPHWWMIDFKTDKEIKYFGTSGAIVYESYAPTSIWFLQGSSDAKNWTNLCDVDHRLWNVSPISYPVQQSIRVINPGLYRYYRLYFPSIHPNNMIVQNIAMSEMDLYPSGYNFTVEGEDKILLGTNLNANDGTAWTGSIPVNYPKGYRGYYMMKYEVSQEQYVEFLNALTLNQQKSRVANSDFTGMVSGDYVFGNQKQPDNRNGIAFISLSTDGKTAVFGNNLNPNNEFYSEDDGQTLACNYLSPADMLAYCDWSGLRPMSELEYEKACRRPYPQIPAKGEFAWNENVGVTPITKLADLTGEKTDRETPFDYRMNVNVGGKLSGPVRNGAFATSKSSQRDAGASYWGMMEMSGNLWEICYNANTEGRKFIGDDVNYSHGDGYITDAGTDITATYWPTANAAFAVRGGSYVGGDSLLRTSDRTYATGNYFSSLTQRDPTVGFRGVRSILNSSGFTAGRIYCQNGLMKDTVCSGEYCILNGEPAENTVGKTTYIWYKSEDNGVSWSILNDAMGISLQYTAVQNKTASLKSVMFKRKVTCAVGEEETMVITLLVDQEVQIPVVQVSLVPAWGYKFVLPSPVVSGLTCKWEFPDGSVKSGNDLTITNYTVANDGVYKAFYVNQYGCESVRKDVKVEGSSSVLIVDNGSYRSWADGSFARSANEYRNPTLPYIYEGAVGNGIYRLDPDGAGSIAPMNIYCDMTTDGGGWTLVWKASINNYNTTSYTFDVGSLSSWSFSEVGMAYMNISTMACSNFTIMSGVQLVADFKAQHPFTYSSKDINVTARYGSYQQENVQLRYGYRNFSTVISDSWYSDSNYGRVGLNWSQQSPYYNAFYSSAGDFCCLGGEKHSQTYCSDSRRMSFWIR